MGPITLFDKSFIQALSLDESVWFDHFFIPNVCPIFYVETLADLAKKFKSNRNPETELQRIAARFPECSSAPCARHTEMCISALLGQPIPMTGQIPVAHGRPVQSSGQTGVVYDHSPEAEAFNRWHSGEFAEIERRFAAIWRKALENLDLDSVKRVFQTVGISGKTCRTLKEAKELAIAFVHAPDKPFDRMKLAMVFFEAPDQVQRAIFERWHLLNYPPIADFAPYASYVLSVEVFFQIALAADLISSDRPSNRTDIAYLFYLPHCMVFVSNDKLHRKCAPLFLRDDQEFVWGEDLKRDLRTINLHYSEISEEEKQKGIGSFARKPPNNPDLLITRLWNRHLPGWDKKEDKGQERSETEDRELVSQLKAMKDGETIPVEHAPTPGEEDYAVLERRVTKRKGNWWQLPADLEVPEVE